MSSCARFMLLALVFCTSGCAAWCRVSGGCPAPVEPRTIVVREPAEPCLRKAPPDNSVTLPDKKPATCPPEFEICFTKAETAALFGALGTANSYASEAWQRCGAKPTP